MAAQKRHPIETFREEVRDKADEVGYQNLDDREFQMLMQDWLLAAIQTSNGRSNGRRQQATFAGLPIAGAGGFWALTELAAWLTAL